MDLFSKLETHSHVHTVESEILHCQVQTLNRQTNFRLDKTLKSGPVPSLPVLGSYGFLLGSYGFLLGSYWVPMGSYWVQIGFLLGSYWDALVFLLGSYWVPM